MTLGPVSEVSEEVFGDITAKEHTHPSKEKTQTNLQ